MSRPTCHHPEPDTVVIERLVAGVPVKACRCEKVAAYHELRKRGSFSREHASLLHMSGSTIAKLNRGEYA